MTEKLTQFRLKVQQIHESLNKKLLQTHGKVISLGDKMINVEADPFAKEALKESFKLDEIKKKVDDLGSTSSNLEKFESSVKKSIEKLLVQLDRTFDERNQVDISMKELALISYTAQGQKTKIKDLFRDKSILQNIESARQTHNLEQSMLMAAHP